MIKENQDPLDFKGYLEIQYVIKNIDKKNVNKRNRLFKGLMGNPGQHGHAGDQGDQGPMV